MRSPGFLALAVAAAALGAGAAGRLPLRPAPPGTIVQNVTAYLAGEAMNSRYSVVASRANIGRSKFTQWYLSVYAQDGDALKRIYQSPGKRDPFGLVPAVEKGHGTQMYFPQETVQIAGAAELMGPARQQAVVVVHAAAADCGSTTVSILSADAGPGPVRLLARVTNPCRLTAEVQPHGVLLQGPYYKPGDPLCCPSNRIVSALLSFDGRFWSVKPRFFALKISASGEPVTIPHAHPTPLFTPIFKAILTTPAPSGPPQPPSRL